MGDRSWLPADKMLITVLFMFVVSLALLCFSLTANEFQRFALGDRAAWIGWGGVVATLFFIVFALGVKALESVFIQRIGPTGSRYLSYALIAGLLAASVSITIHGMSEALMQPRVKKVVIRMDDLPRDLEGICIVQVTDLHITSSVRYDRIRKLVERVNALEPDIIAFTGDIFDRPPDLIREETAALAGLRSKLGNFFVTGNHEYFHGADEWALEMEALGFRVLSNNHRRIPLGRSAILVGGVPDPRGDSSRPHPEKAVGAGEEAGIRILLSHRPDLVYAADTAGFDLLLSGHTHGGQIGLISLLRSILQPFQSGLYAFNRMSVYVSNGAGYWGIPLRFGAPSEISLLELTGVKSGTAAKRVAGNRPRVTGGW